MAGMAPQGTVCAPTCTLSDTAAKGFNRIGERNRSRLRAGRDDVDRVAS